MLVGTLRFVWVGRDWISARRVLFLFPTLPYELNHIRRTLMREHHRTESAKFIFADKFVRSNGSSYLPSALADIVTGSQWLGQTAVTPVFGPIARAILTVLRVSTFASLTLIK